MYLKLRNLFIISLFVAVFLGCEDKSKEQLDIGFIAGLSGKYSSLGISIRNGFTLAFDEINHEIAGKKINIIEKDDKQNLDDAQNAMQYFIDNKINLVVGNATSSMTQKSLSMIKNKNDMLLISATASSSEFTKIDDNFLRIQVEHSKKRYSQLATFISENNFNDIYLIHDSKNKSHVSGYSKILQDEVFKKTGKHYKYSIDINQPYNEIVEQLKAKKDDLIIIVANSVDSSNMIQFLRLKGLESSILCSGWAKTLDFIENGGKSIEDVIFFTGYDDHSQNKNFKNFVSKYKEKYNETPSVFAAQGYELGKILIRKLKENDNVKFLKDNLLKEKIYEGLQGKIIFDKYGDVSREYFFMKVRNGQFILYK